MNQFSFPSNVTELPAKHGVFLSIQHSEETDWFQTDLGFVKEVDRFVCSHRRQPFFLHASCGDSLSQLPLETQWLGLLHKDGSYTVCYPLAHGSFRSSLSGTTENSLLVTCETGSDALLGDTALACYLAHGTDFYALVRNAAQDIATLGTVRLRSEKSVPQTMQYFGWCTWNAFYENVSAEKLLAGIESFQQQGFVPKFILLDDGWQTVNSTRSDRGKHQLSSFAPNEKFGGDMTDLISHVKQEYGVALFYVWHAVMGYWGGIDPNSPEMQTYQVKEKCQRHSKGMFEVNQKYASSLHFPYGMADPNHIYRFYNDYHNSLRRQGVDGVKVDVQAAMEGAAYGEKGGRVGMVRNNHYALEASTQLHFQGELINCMSCNNDIIYSLLNSNMMRSSDDFFPTIPESHGKHIYYNAINSIFMGEFTYCDWDMFQTTHPYGAFHAASRAISGGPVYVSDTAEEHNFELIRKLTLHDGTIPPCTDIAKPTLDSLFVDHEHSDILLKLYNTTLFGGVVGVFHLGEDQEKKVSVRPSDLPDYTNGQYAVYLHQKDELLLMDANEELPFKMKQKEYELCTIVPVKDGIAPIGLSDKFNSSGTVLHWEGNHLILSDGGRFECYCETAPDAVLVNGVPCEMTFHQNRLTVETGTTGQTEVVLSYGTTQ